MIDQAGAWWSEVFAGAPRSLVGVLAALAGAGALVNPSLARAQTCPNAAFRTDASAHLPDCRAYELVSPAEKGSEDAFGEGNFSRAAAGGEQLAYTSKNVFAQSPGAGVETAYLGSREGGEWLTGALAPRVDQPLPADTVTYGFSDDLAQTVMRVPLEALTPQAPEGVYNLFAANAHGAYELVTSAAPTTAIPAGCDTCYLEHDVPVFMGASTDFTHVIFEANESLATAPTYAADPTRREDLYESDLAEPVAQRVHPVGILPDGTLAAGAQAGAGGGNDNAEEVRHVEHAISADGSRILFTAQADDGAPDPEQQDLPELYDRIGGPTGKTIEISAPAPAASAKTCRTPNHNCKPEAAEYWDASEDGSVVLFTSRAELTEDSNTGPETAGQENAGDDLYSYDVESGTLTDLTSDPGETDGAQVQGVLGASSGATSVYFVARGVLAGKNAEGGEPTAGAENLYLHEGAPGEAGTTVFIATLEPAVPGEEREHPGDSRDWTAIPEESQAYVTPDGRYLAFTSHLPLTGYDNSDQHTEAPDSEVFQYSAASARLQCASCNPEARTRPVGNAFIGREIAEQSERTSPLYQARALTDDGPVRLFFSSSDTLVPEASSPYVKVYEFEEGAVHMISGGASESNDIFMDAGEDGDDVFFATAEQLTPNDRDQASDVYDARVDGGREYPLSTTTACQGEGCLPAEALPPALVHPGASLNGAGELQTAGVAAAHSSKAPTPTRSQRLAKALAACRRKPRRERAACVRSAERRYGPRRKAAHVPQHHRRRGR